MKFYNKNKVGSDTAAVLKSRTKGSKVLFTCMFILFSIYSLSLIFPFVTLFINSLKGGLEYITDLNNKNILALPDKLLFSNYKNAFTSMSMVNSLGEKVYLFEMFINSISYALLTSVSSAFCSTLTGYALAKYDFKLRSILYGISIITLTIPIVGNMAAIIKLTYSIGIYNTIFYPIIMNFGGFGFNFLILYGFFKNVSWSYAEAAFIDGATHFDVFFKVMLPQVIPTLITLIIVSFIGAWNDYQTVLLYLPDLPTLAAGLYRVEKSITRGGNYPIFFAGILISVVPILIMFTCFFDTIMQNYSIGGLKG